MGKMKHRKKSILRWGISMGLISIYLMSQSNETLVQANESRSSHIGLFDGETTFSLSSNTGILPTIELKTKDVYGNIETYDSSSGNVVIPENEGDKTVKSAILKGRTLVNRFDFEPIFEQRSGGNWDIENKGNGVYTITAKKDRVDLRGWFINHPEVNQTHTMIFEVFENTATTGYARLWARTQMTNVACNMDGEGFEAGEIGVYKLVGRGKIANGYAIVFEGNWNTGESITFRLTWLDGDHYHLDSGLNTGSVKLPILTISNEDNSQTATITIEEDINLQSNGDVYDELDLMTGKFTQRIGEDGSVLDQEIVRYIKINSTHTFEQNKETDVSVVGNVTPTLGSITVPTDPLTFSLNPNLEDGQQFIAPTFSISNDSQAPIGLGIKSFEQTTDILNDVLPDKHNSWEGLTKAQSRDIALALEPQSSDSWISLNEGSYYVANTSDVELGQIKGNSTVDFKFSALHGQSFTETLNPQYKLTFVFQL